MEKQIKTDNFVEGKYLIALLRAAIRSEKAPAPPAELNWDRLYRLAKSHMVAATVARTVNSTGACPQELLPKWEKAERATFQKGLFFDSEREQILQAFDEAGIKYLPLKGIIIREFYPSKGMRQFADNDILYDAQRQDDVDKIMRELEYQSDGFSSAHDIYTKKPFYNFELHRTLFDERFDVDYFDRVWERAVKDEGENCAYHMTNEDFYIYILGHFQKHYENGGTGLRAFADLYLIRRNVKIENRDYVEACLRETGMTEFEKKVIEISESFFGESEREVSEETLEYIFSSGAFGTEQHIAENRSKEHGRAGGLFRLIFPPYREMVVRNRILKKAPILLPFFWIERLFTFVFDKRKIKKALLAIQVFFRGSGRGKKGND
jgi:hypothetical protein